MLQPIHGIRTISKENIKELDRVLFLWYLECLGTWLLKKGRNDVLIKM